MALTAMSSDELRQWLSASGDPRMNQLATVFGALRQALASAQASSAVSV